MIDNELLKILTVVDNENFSGGPDRYLWRSTDLPCCLVLTVKEEDNWVHWSCCFWMIQKLNESCGWTWQEVTDMVPNTVAKAYIALKEEKARPV